ncbi:uncharacterized protein LOC144140004 [Haemaphysalis longicornis]
MRLDGLSNSSWQRYDFTIQHRKGSQNQVAYALSRAPLPPSSDAEAPALVAAVDADARWGTLVSRADLLAAQRADGLCRKIIEHVGAQGAAPTSNSGHFQKRRRVLVCRPMLWPSASACATRYRLPGSSLTLLVSSRRSSTTGVVEMFSLRLATWFSGALIH